MADLQNIGVFLEIKTHMTALLPKVFSINYFNFIE